MILTILKSLCIFALLFSLAGCATIRRDRCYLHENRYQSMKLVFDQTASYQRTAQAMDDADWARCEINQFRYRLRKELEMEGIDFAMLEQEMEPNRERLDYNPGVVK